MDTFDDDPIDDARRDRLVALARRLHVRDEAEDLVHDVLLRIGTDPRDDIRSLDAWLTTAVRNAAIDARRRVAREHRLLAAYAHEANIGDGEEPALDENDALLDTLIAAVGARTSAALVLRHVFDMPYEDLAVGTGRSAATWRQFLHRALARLRSDATARRALDDDETRAAALCRSAIAAGDVARLHAWVRTGVVAQSGATRGGAMFGVARSGRAQPMLACVHGRYVLALVQDGVVLCALPVGADEVATLE